MTINNSLIDLSNYELKVYTALVKLGKATATNISKISGVPQGKVYAVLESLIKKGLTNSIPNQPIEFIAANPENLIQILNKKKEEIRDIEKEISELKKAYIEEKEIIESKIIIKRGKNAFYEIVKNLKIPQKYDYNIRWTSEYNKEWAKKEKTSLEKGLDIKVLARYDKNTKENVSKWLKFNKNIKPIENNGVAMAIQDDEEVMISIIGCDTIILVRDSAFAKIMKKMFLETYSNTINIIKKV